MTATVALPAPPEPYLGTGPLRATPHRLLAIGSGLGGLIATRALKRDLVTISDVVVFLARITAQGKSQVHHQASLWFPVLPTTAAVFTTVGVLTMLYVAIIRKRNHHQNATTAKYSSYDGHLQSSPPIPKGWH